MLIPVCGRFVQPWIHIAIWRRIKHPSPLMSRQVTPSPKRNQPPLSREISVIKFFGLVKDYKIRQKYFQLGIFRLTATAQPYRTLWGSLSHADCSPTAASHTPAAIKTVASIATTTSSGSRGNAHKHTHKRLP